MERFVWDSRKDAENLRKHGISFATAEAVFDDPLLVSREDFEISERRYQAIGRVSTIQILLVVHTVTYKDEDDTVIRIISADVQTVENDDFMVSHARIPCSPLSEDSLKQLAALEDVKDEDIDLSDMPEWTEEDFRNAMHGPWTPREPNTLPLYIDAAVAEWLETAAKSRSFLINFILKREAQREKRARATKWAEFDKAS